MHFNRTQGAVTTLRAEIIFASSAAVYGDTALLPVPEDAPKQPASFYGLSKLTAEKYIQMYHELYGLHYVILRYANVYGERQGDRGEGGVVTIATGVVECDRARLDETCLGVELPEGTYVHLDVADSGCGMDAETRRRAVEPFFTTKPDNRGLGLSAVLGIMREHKGALCLKSDVGVGTTVRMLFPRENAG